MIETKSPSYSVLSNEIRCRKCSYLLENPSTENPKCRNCNTNHDSLIHGNLINKWARFGEGRIKLLEYFNPNPKTCHVDFSFENLLHPELLQMRIKYQLSQFARNYKDEFSAQLALMEWQNQNQLSGGPDIKVGRDDQVFDVINNNQCNSNMMQLPIDNCAGFAYAFVKLAAATGHIARAVNNISQSTPYRLFSAPHVTVEIWSNQYIKWIAFDTLFNLSWWKNGMPLSALEIRDEYFKNDGKDINIKWGANLVTMPVNNLLGPTAGHPMKYYWVLYLKANNFFSFSPEEKFWRALLFRDEFNKGQAFTTYPNNNRRPYAGEGTLDESSDKKDFNWPLNLTQIIATAGSTNKLYLKLFTWTPNFDQFSIQWNEQSIKSYEKEYKFILKPGINKLTAQSINILGIKGHPSKIVIEYDPN